MKKLWFGPLLFLLLSCSVEDSPVEDAAIEVSDMAVDAKPFDLGPVPGTDMPDMSAPSDMSVPPDMSAPSDMSGMVRIQALSWVYFDPYGTPCAAPCADFPRGTVVTLKAQGIDPIVWTLGPCQKLEDHFCKFRATESVQVDYRKK